MPLLTYFPISSHVRESGSFKSLFGVQSDAIPFFYITFRLDTLYLGISIYEFAVGYLLRFPLKISSTMRHYEAHVGQNDFCDLKILTDHQIFD